MLIVLIILSVLNIISWVIMFRVYSVLSKCLIKQGQGRSYVKVVTSKDIYGWVLNRDITSVSSNMKAMEEHIRIETKGSTDLIKVGNIKSIENIKNGWRVVVGNL